LTTLITGAGLVGWLTAELLAARGDEVVLVDIRKPALPDRPNLAFMRCDVTDLTTLAEIVTRFGVRRIVHTAAMLSTGIRQDPARGVHVNVMGTTNVLEIARTRGIERVVCASSTTVAYTGFGRHGPEAIEEDIPLHVVSERPASIYAATKLAGEHLAYLYNDLYGLDVIVLRYTAVLGGGSEPPSSVPGRLLAKLAHGGKTGEKVVLDDPFVLWGGREEFVDARDCARANVCALDAVTPAQKVFNIAPGTWFSLGEFIEVVRRVHPRLQAEWPADITTGFAGFAHPRPAPSSVVAASRDLSFECTFSLEETVRHWT
jgi:UDP-glucose 4-epimerase